MPPSLHPLTPAHHDAAADVIADAFLDDPGWVAVGPRNPAARRRYIRRVVHGALRAGERWCGPSWYAGEGDDVHAVLTGCAPGLWPPPRVRMLRYLATGPLLAGPAPLVRSLATERVVEKAHPAYDHFLVWMLAVGPARQRQGLGGRLMREALAQADAAAAPTYLWTGNPDNLPYYRSHGFEILGEATISRGAPNWFMQRPAR
jgi:GNAT superfamily N-acetyltransferase